MKPLTTDWRQVKLVKETQRDEIPYITDKELERGGRYAGSVGSFRRRHKCRNDYAGPSARARPR